eukprot:6192974-Pleurochrysis_carterae.AAC.5
MSLTVLIKLGPGQRMLSPPVRHGLGKRREREVSAHLAADFAGPCGWLRRGALLCVLLIFALWWLHVPGTYTSSPAGAIENVAGTLEHGAQDGHCCAYSTPCGEHAEYDQNRVQCRARGDE